MKKMTLRILHLQRRLKATKNNLSKEKILMMKILNKKNLETNLHKKKKVKTMTSSRTSSTEKKPASIKPANTKSQFNPSSKNSMGAPGLDREKIAREAEKAKKTKGSFVGTDSTLHTKF